MIEAKDYPNRVIGKRVLSPADAVDRQIVAVNLDESPLAWLARRGLLTARQVAAGERLRADHGRSGLAARVTMRWDPTPTGKHEGGGAHGQALAGLDAKRRFEQALEAAGPGLRDVLWRVVCEGEGLAVAEKELGWPVRAAKLVLGMALDRLAIFYDNHYGHFSVDNRDDVV
ncbi:MAG: DUF6456 domain-containing protein [Sandaracinobacteroides sp.]